MVVTPREVDDLVRLVDGRCATGILVETAAAVACADELATVPVDRVYFGLNDFAINRGDASIFTAVLDGTVAAVRATFPEAAFGFGGMTDVGAGEPVPAVRLLEEMARLDCTYTFLRRSFRRDSLLRPTKTIVAGIQAAWEQCRTRDLEQVQRDRSALTAVLRELGA
jgi:hypothetical protein